LGEVLFAGGAVWLVRAVVVVVVAGIRVVVLVR
jgi:hypothetical protein